ncbi:MAG: hypothetical protein EYC70_11480 [Planctomycetota bacterium]|nr:MAG: hypothetical protein EYC70_11480 [Planctomycetota bacterium]
MPLHDPDPADPMELCGVHVAGLAGEDTACMARCLAEEFLRLGYAPAAVLSLFRSPLYALAHRAWVELGESAVSTLVAEAAQGLPRPTSRQRSLAGGFDV